MKQKVFKRNKQVKTGLHFLMSGILVLSAVLPLTTVFAESESTQFEPTIEKQSVESDTTPEKNNSAATLETNQSMASDALIMPNPNISIPLDEKTTIWMDEFTQVNGVNDGNFENEYNVYYFSFNDVQRWTYNDYMQEVSPGINVVKALLVGSDLVNGLMDVETALPLLQEYVPDNGFTTIEEIQEWTDDFFAPYIGKSLQEEELTALMDKPIELIDDPIYSGDLRVKDPIVYNFVDNNVNVKIHYVYSDGTQAAEDRDITTYVGKSSVTIDSPVIEGYEADQPAVDVEFTKEGLTEYTVTYYKPGELPQVGGQVTIQYVDEKGNPIADEVIKSGNIGESYTSEQKEIDGYTFKEVKGAASGVFSDYPQLVVYVYQKEVSDTDQSTTSNDKKPTDSTPPSEKGAASNGQKPKESGNVPPIHAQNGSYTKNNTKEGRKDRKLPQTNEQANPFLTVLGVGLVLLLLAVDLWHKKRFPFIR